MAPSKEEIELELREYLTQVRELQLCINFIEDADLEHYIYCDALELLKSELYYAKLRVDKTKKELKL